MNNADVYPLHGGCTVSPDSKETEPGSSGRETLSAGKNIRVVLAPCHTKSVPIAFSGGVDISEVYGCHLLR